MKNFLVSFPYEVRKGLAEADTVAEAIGRSEDLGAVGPGYLLSIKESCVEERPEGDAPGWDSREDHRKVATYRYEGGIVVRLTLYGWDDSHYGCQWQAGAAHVRFLLEGENPEVKHQMVLGRPENYGTEIRAKARRAGIAASQRQGKFRAFQIARDKKTEEIKLSLGL